MKNQFKNFSLFIITALISVLFVNCQKESANVINDKIVISNTKVSAITQIRATISASITSNGGNEITERGVCYDTMPNPTIASMKMVYDSAKVDSFSLRISELRPNKKYYARAYATNSKGTGYGEEVSFTTRSVQLGDFFQGGTVFYIDATGTHGLIAALQGLDYSAEWGCKGVSIPGTTTIVGSGKANTLAITKGCKTAGISARWADQLDNLGFTDWYLPSKDELTEMFKQRKTVVLNGAARWSSSEADANSAWALTFDAAGTPVPVIMDKSTVIGVRPIRAFSY
jgi:hypothetical protein